MQSFRTTLCKGNGKVKIIAHRSTIKTIRRGDKNWLLTSGSVICPRAGFEINPDCPDSYKSVLRQCIDNGWILPVAHIHDSELAWDILKS